MTPQQVLVNIVVTSAGTDTAGNRVRDTLRGIARDAAAAAHDSALSFTSIFGANFFADLAAGGVRAFLTGIRQLVQGAIAAARDVESAFAGLRGIGRNLGLDPEDVVQSVKNLDLVKQGLLTVGDAATATKNLLAAGFNLEQSNELVKRFADVAAFGRQASLSFGYAISSATEGVKNQNSILVDNIGLTKNLSVIMAEAGFTIQDLSDKTKGAAARQALYAGLVRESAIQHGDAARILDTYQGKMIQVESAQTRFLQSLGKTITESTLLRASLTALVAILDSMGRNVGAVIALTVAIAALTVALVVASTTGTGLVTVFRSVIATFTVLRAVMIGNAALVAGQTATLIAMTAGWLALALAVGGVIYWLTKSNDTQRKFADVSQQTIDNLVKSRDQMQRQQVGLANLGQETTGLTEKQVLLDSVYKSLDAASRTRVDVMSQEGDKARALQTEIERLIQLRREELEVIARNTTAQLVVKLQEIEANNAISQSLQARIRLMDDLQTRIRAGTIGQSGLEQSSDPFVRDIAALDQTTILERLAQRSAEASVKIGDLRTATEGLTTEADKLGRKQFALAGFLDTTTEGLVQQTFRYNLLNGNQQSAIGLVTQFGIQQGYATPKVQAQTNAIQAQVDALRELSDAQALSSARGKIINEVLAGIAERSGGNVKAGREELAAIIKENRDGVGQVIQSQQAYNKVLKELNDIISPKEHKQRTRQQESELDRLTKRVRDLTGQIASFTDLSSQEFTLRFRSESLERVKRDFERILDLRRELGLPLVTQLPKASDIAGQQAQVELLERAVALRDAVKRATNEQREAEDKLIVLQRTAGLPVIDEGTRLQIKYLEAVRARSNGERELTAEVALQSRLRRDALADEVGQTKEAFQNLQLDVTRQLNELDAAIKQNELLSLIEGGGQVSIEQQISGRIDIKEPRVPGELVQIASNSASIKTSVDLILSRLPGAGGASADATDFNARDFLPKLQAFLSSIGAGGTISARGQTATHNRFNLDHRNAIDVGIAPGTEQGRLLEEFLQSQGVPFRAITAADIAKGVKATRPHHHIGFPSPGTSRDFAAGTLAPSAGRTGASEAPGSPSFVERLISGAQTIVDAGSSLLERAGVSRQTQAGLLKGFAAASAADRADTPEQINSTAIGVDVAEAQRQIAVKTAIKERGDLERAATAEIRTNEARLTHQLIDFDTDVRLHRSRTLLQRQQEERDTALNIRQLTEDLANFDANTGNARQRVEQRVVEDRLRGRMSLREEIVRLNDEIATSGEDSALRETVAYLEATRAIQQAHEEAAASVIKSQVKIADATVYHADIANAKVLEFLASQKSVTDAIADAKIGVIQTTFNYVDNGLQRVFGRLGEIGKLISSIISDLLRPALTQAFGRLFNLPGFGKGQQGGGGSILSLLTGGGSGGGGAGGVGSILTGGFAGGASPAASVFGAPNSAQLAANFFNTGSVFGGQQAGGINALNAAFGQGAGPNFLPSLSGGTAQQAANAGLLTAALSSPQLASSRISSVGGFQNFFGTAAAPSGLTLAAALAAPAIGAQLGGAFFRDSRLASGIGTAAGLVLGGGAGVALLGGSGAAIFGAGGALSSLGSIAPFLVNPFVLGAAGVALAAAYYINRNAQRRKYETQRDALTRDANTALDQLIAQVKSGRLDGASALAQAATIRANYLTEAGKIPERKTREHALATVRELDYRINILKQVAEAADRAAEVRERLVATFDSGGAGILTSDIGRVSVGGLPRRDRHLAFVSDDEVIVNAQQRATIGDSAFRRAGVPGFATGQVSPSRPSRPSSAAASGVAGVGDITVLAVLVASDEAADQLIDRASANVIAKKVRLHVRDSGKAGLVGDFIEELSR